MTERSNRRPWAILATVLVLIVAPQVVGQEHGYVGSGKCKMCHMKEWKSWSETKMANAFEALKPGERAEAKRRVGLDPEKDYTADPECVRCHVTGHAGKGGFSNVGETPDLAGVGCESCHGPGGTYLEPEYMSLKNKSYSKSDLVAVGLVDQVTREQCVSCHNADSPFVGDGYVFDFESRKDQGIHELFPLKYEH